MNISIDDREALNSTHVQSSDRTDAEVGELLRMPIMRDEPLLSRSSRFDETLKASIAQALEMGRELMWHDDEPNQETVEKNQTTYTQRLGQSCEPTFDEFKVVRNGMRSSSNIAQPRLRRKITNESTVSNHPDSWSEFINRRIPCNKSFSSLSRRGVRNSEKSIYLDDLPQHLNISIDSANCDDISCLMDDAVEVSSCLSIDSSILNDFLYGGCSDYDENERDSSKNSDTVSTCEIVNKFPMVIITDVK
jgi:hypothetical protein